MNDPVAKPSRASDCDAELAQARADYAKLQAESKARTENLESEIREWKSRAHELGAVWSKATRWKRALVFCGAAPLDWAMGILLILTELLARGLCRLSRVPAPQFAVTDFRHCSIVIVTWRGKDLLTESLPPLMRALRRHGAAHQVIVVDNASADGTQEYLTEQFPNIKVISSHRNEFYGGGNNLSVQEAQNGIVVLLNNDMIVDEDFLEPLLAAFRDPDVFAVASQVFLGDALKARQETGKTRARFNGCELDWGH
ncbi:MAG: glycosyltransferase, partial [Acidobacteria bacterium]|nr:glycosyltransferase [Acidobacteriota bacterium]